LQAIDIVKKLIPCLLCMITTTALAKFGGKKSFEFLNVPNNARLAALGGVNVSLSDHDNCQSMWIWRNF
jgi:hypothetical protein